jgi:hypothetical protein
MNLASDLAYEGLVLQFWNIKTQQGKNLQVKQTNKNDGEI